MSKYHTIPYIVCGRLSLSKSRIQTKLADIDISTRESSQNPHEVCPGHQVKHNGNPWWDTTWTPLKVKVTSYTQVNTDFNLIPI